MKALALFTCFICAPLAFALSTEDIQLRQLVEKSEQQLQSIRELLKVSRQDAETQEAAKKSLEKLSAGIDQSIGAFQGTKAYEQALLQLQAEELKEQAKRSGTRAEPEKKRFLEFQNQTLQANSDTLAQVKKLEDSLRTAGQGFIPKIQSQAQLGNWQASARISAQLGELLSAVHGLRQDLAGTNTLGVFVNSADAQNQKQREAESHAKR